MCRGLKSPLRWFTATLLSTPRGRQRGGCVGARADGFCNFPLQTTTIFQGSCKPGIAAVELIDLLCLIIIHRLFNRGPETLGTTKSQRLTTTKYLCRKKVCKTLIYLMELKRRPGIIFYAHNWALKKQTVRSGGLADSWSSLVGQLASKSGQPGWLLPLVLHVLLGICRCSNICALYQLLVMQVFMSMPFRYSVSHSPLKQKIPSKQQGKLYLLFLLLIWTLGNFACCPQCLVCQF